MSVVEGRRPGRGVWGHIVGWATPVVLAMAVVWHWYSGALEKHSGYWFGLTAAAATLSAGLVVLAAVGARRDAGSGPARVAPVVAVMVWVAGMAWYFAVVYLGFGEACSGSTGACSWECINQAGEDSQALSVAAVVAATAALPALRAVSRRVESRVVGGIGPVLVLMLFVTAGFLASPHGTSTRCFAAAAVSGPSCGAAATAEP
ncbi:hypothetical protein [Catenulispora subtropica]|uniref:Integral membrane protein n=1 Tax=Catenulispora subtropica TaxID=450798 RepID=A0ABP5ENW4_9ACTN